MSSEGPLRKILKGGRPIMTRIQERFQVMDMPVDAIVQKIREFETQNPQPWTWWEVGVRPQALTRLVTEGRVQIVDSGKPHRYRLKA